MSERAMPERGTEREIGTIDAPTLTSGWRRILRAPVEAPRALPPLQRRVDARTDATLDVEVFSIDPSRDRETGELFFALSLDERTENLSRRGLCVRCERPPEIGARVLLQVRVPQEPPIDVVGLARWTSVAYEPGTHGGRAFARVGIELLGGAPRALERWDRALARLSQPSVASPGGRR
jgi:hypothetical protein